MLYRSRQLGAPRRGRRVLAWATTAGSPLPREIREIQFYGEKMGTLAPAGLVPIGLKIIHPSAGITQIRYCGSEPL